MTSPREAEMMERIAALIAEYPDVVAPQICDYHQRSLGDCDETCTTHADAAEWFLRDWALVTGWQHYDPDAGDDDWINTVTSRTSSTWGMRGLLTTCAETFR